jgi:hypothetical protein
LDVKSVVLSMALGVGGFAGAVAAFGPVVVRAQTIPVVSDWLCTTVKGSPLLVSRLHLIVIGGRTLRGSGADATGQLVTVGGTLEGNKVFGTFKNASQTGWIKLTFTSDTAFNGVWGIGEDYDHPSGTLNGRYQPEQVVPPG